MVAFVSATSKTPNGLLHFLSEAPIASTPIAVAKRHPPFQTRKPLLRYCPAGRFRRRPRRTRRVLHTLNRTRRRSGPGGSNVGLFVATPTSTPLGLHGPAFRSDELGPAGGVTSLGMFDVTGDCQMLHHTSSSPPCSTLLLLGPAVPRPPIQKSALASRQSCLPLNILITNRQSENIRTHGDPVG